MGRSRARQRIVMATAAERRWQAWRLSDADGKHQALKIVRNRSAVALLQIALKHLQNALKSLKAPFEK
jgi:hypothetical protein